MNEIINKWNKWSLEEEYKNRPESIVVTQYLIDNNIKIIDLKYLTELNYTTLNKDIIIIMGQYNISPCKNKINCSKYRCCIVCRIDYLTSINKIKIIGDNASERDNK